MLTDDRLRGSFRERERSDEEKIGREWVEGRRLERG
jgi:hypothetical protein